MLAMLLYTAATQKSLALLACRDVQSEYVDASGADFDAPDADSDQQDAGGVQSRLVADLDVRCDVSAGTRASVAVPLLMLWTLGLPVALAVALSWLDRRDPWVRYLLSFAFANYRPSVYFWEAFDAIRKALLAFVTVLLVPYGPNIQIMAALFVAVPTGFLHANLWPY